MVRKTLGMQSQQMMMSAWGTTKGIQQKIEEETDM